MVIRVRAASSPLATSSHRASLCNQKLIETGAFQTNSLPMDCLLSGFSGQESASLRKRVRENTNICLANKACFNLHLKGVARRCRGWAAYVNVQVCKLRDSSSTTKEYTLDFKELSLPGDSSVFRALTFSVERPPVSG